MKVKPSDTGTITKNDDNSLTVTGGGTVTKADGSKIAEVTGDFTVKADGTIEMPQGTTAVTRDNKATMNIATTKQGTRTTIDK